jgi:hypothetical protein
MRLNKFVMPVVVIVTLLGSVAVAQLLGWWLPSVDVNAMNTPDQIRGWMTLQQVSDQFKIPQEILYEKLAIPADVPPTTPLRDLEGQVTAFEVDTVRQMVADYLQPPAQ